LKQTPVSNQYAKISSAFNVARGMKAHLLLMNEKENVTA
jgi:hypothetical protein